MTERAASPRATPGDPNCPICHGIGYVREDLPIDDPNFGKIQICSCRYKELSQAAHERLYQLSNLDAFKPMTFESFSVKGRVGLGDNQMQSLVNALSQSQQFAQELKGWLLLIGGYGCGKTHLAAAVAHQAVQNGIATIFLTVPDLLDWLRFAFSSTESSFEARFDEIRNVRLLVLDDLGTQNATPWAEEKLYQIINYRYVSRLPTVMTTNQDMAELDGRIRSRLQDADLVTKVHITAPDYRAPNQDSSHPELSSLHLHSKRTFGNFSLREHEHLPAEQQHDLEEAFRAARQFAEDGRGWLVLIGKYGTGKTHLAAAIGNSQPEAPMFVVVPDLLDHLRATFSPNSSVSYDRMFEEVRTSPLLILDDLGTQSATPWAREKLYQILNYRYNAELPTVITTSFSLEEIDPRIRSRMEDRHLCKVCYLDIPSYRVGSTTTGSAGRKSKRPRG